MLYGHCKEPRLRSFSNGDVDVENGDHQRGVLNSWKEISQYLGRGVRTVQRWEAELGLPVRRPRGKSRSAVIAMTAELDRWMASTPLHVLESRNGSPVPDRRMQVLVIEDQIADLNSCVSILRRMGAVQVDALSSIPAALARLEMVLAGKLPKPDLIILDMHFSSLSGFDVLRFIRMHANLKSIPVIVWTVMDENRQELFEVYGVRQVVGKLAGPRELQEAILSAGSRAAA
jgi:CheY-like chemotaxis protein